MITQGPHQPPEFIAELKATRTVFMGVYLLDEEGEIVTGTKPMTKEEEQKYDDVDFIIARVND